MDQEIEPDSRVKQIAAAFDSGVIDLSGLLDLYSGRGTEAYDPKLLLKLVVFEQVRGRSQPIQWYRDLSDSRQVRWLTFGTTVSKTTIYDFRDRIAPILESINTQLVQLALQEGLLTGCRASLDGTTIASNASRRKLLNMRQIDGRLERLRQALDPFDSVPLCWTASTFDAELRPGWMAPTYSGMLLQQRRYAAAKLRLETMLGQNARRRKDKQKPVDRVLINVTDPDSAFGPDKDKVFRSLYNVQVVCDLDSEVVMAYQVFSQAVDSGTLQPMIGKLLDAEMPIESLLADAGYPSGPDLAYCERVGVVLYAPWQENAFTQQKKSADPGGSAFEKRDFQWDGQAEVYWCPAGKRLVFVEHKNRQRADGSQVYFDLYRGSASQCQACPMRTRCTQSAHGRSVRRDTHQEEIDRLQARMASFEAKLLYHHRGQTIERIFGDFKEHRDSRRIRGRSKARAAVQIGIAVLAHNLLIIQRLRKLKEQEEPPT